MFNNWKNKVEKLINRKFLHTRVVPDRSGDCRRLWEPIQHKVGSGEGHNFASSAQPWPLGSFLQGGLQRSWQSLCTVEKSPSASLPSCAPPTAQALCSWLRRSRAVSSSMERPTRRQARQAEVSSQQPPWVILEANPPDVSVSRWLQLHTALWLQPCKMPDPEPPALECWLAETEVTHVCRFKMEPFTLQQITTNPAQHLSSGGGAASAAFPRLTAFLGSSALATWGVALLCGTFRHAASNQRLVFMDRLEVPSGGRTVPSTFV